MERRITVRGIIVKDGKLLCAKLAPYPGAIRGDFWCTFGGTLDPGESILAGLKRELLEETGIEPEIGNLLYVQQFMHPTGEHIEFFFHILNADDYAAIEMSKTTHGQAEIAEYGFIDPSKETVLPKFLQTEDFNRLNPVQPTKFFYYA